MKKTNLFFPAFFVLLLLNVFSGCGRIGTGVKESLKHGGVITAGITQGIDVFESDHDRNDLKLFYNSIYETLVTIVPGKDGPQPQLAEKWDISGNRLEYLFHIRKGVKFHDETVLDAETAALSLQKTRSDCLSGVKPAGSAEKAVYSNIKYITAIDRYLLKITLYRHDPFFIYSMADSSAIISHSDTLSEEMDSADKAVAGGKPFFPAGTGPFLIAADPYQDFIFADRFEEYWGTPAYLERIVFRFIPDGTTGYLALKAGEIDILSVSDVTVFKKIKENTQLRTASGFSGRVCYLFFSPGSDFFSSSEMRLAAASAFNRREFTEEAYGETNFVTAENFPYFFRFTGSGKERVPYSPDKADEIMQGTGVPELPDSRLYYEIFQEERKTVNRGLSGAIQKQLPFSGVKALASGSDKKNEISHGDLIYAEAWNVLFNPLLIEKAYSGKAAYGIDELIPGDLYSSLLYEALTSDDSDAINSYYDSAADNLSVTLPWFPVVCSIDMYAMSRDIAGMNPAADGRINPAEIWIRKR